MSELWVDMDIRFEHFNKSLILINEDVKSENLKVAGKVKANNSKGNINISLEL